MRYISTRGQAPALSFSAAVLAGLAPDGGLYVPERLPQLPADWQVKYHDLSFADLAAELVALFVDPSDIPHADLRRLALKSFGPHSRFAPGADVTPLHPLARAVPAPAMMTRRTNAPHRTPLKIEILEVVLGATLGFKDGGGQFHGTSSISPVQEAQMTSVLDENVCNVAVDGTFDDCQALVKQLFSDPAARDEFQLAAVNSINFARILAQITYYVHSYLRLKDQHDQLVYSVPSGNFGDVLAGMYARAMGVPIAKLVIATNANDILHRFLRSGIYSPDPAWTPKSAADAAAHVPATATPTLSPAMDITVASNFERALLAWAPNGATDVRQWMEDLKTQGGFAVPASVVDQARQVFLSHRVPDHEIVDTIGRYYDACDYILDPHTAVGVRAAEQFGAGLFPRTTVPAGNVHFVCLSTAHPGKFGDAVHAGLRRSRRAQGVGSEEALDALFVPPVLQALKNVPRRVVRVQDGTAAEVARVLRSEWPMVEVQKAKL
ncbi:threonine synthase [Allomyces macrogynus ATCC 38327]|uniref:Threonine synthase n=1 Tax=Allomyces macrogynus (strain ATCC 38327) TaxID=578462 RepID=A0A0L0SBU0_ALLM3|nr:threonine synthase [Allomyces macrogynus ATCC 38327]|eukprot:KNE59907.1 threonine synthase [Allomyces macrogynus ATCC 38327]